MHRKQELTPEQQAADARRVRVCAIVTALLSIVVLLFIVVGTPLDQFTPNDTAINRDVCFSFFGQKKCGSSRRISGLPMKGFRCSTVNQMMTCGAAMSIISILTSVVAAVVYMLYAAGINPRVTRVVALVAATCTFSFLLIAWAMAVQSRDTTCEVVGNPDGYRLKSEFKLGAGFALHITAWCVQAITFVFILLSWGE